MAETAWSNLKDEPVECPCGECGLWGQPRVRVWAGETTGHVRRCTCRRCRGGRTRASARRRENRIAKDTEGIRELLSGGVSGRDVTTGSGIWIEETANKSLVAGLRRWWESKQIRAKTRRCREQSVARWVFVASWSGRPQVVIEPYESWAAHERARTGSDG